MKLKIEETKFTEEEVSVILEMYDVMAKKNFTVRQALRLLNCLEQSIISARSEEADKIVL